MMLISSIFSFVIISTGAQEDFCLPCDHVRCDGSTFGITGCNDAADACQYCAECAWNSNNLPGCEASDGTNDALSCCSSLPTTDNPSPSPTTDNPTTDNPTTAIAVRLVIPLLFQQLFRQQLLSQQSLNQPL